MIYLAISIGFFVFLLHRTDFLLEYAKIFGLKKLFRLYKYEDWKAANYKEPKWWLIHYPVFIRELKFDNKIARFIANLIGCHICSITFLSLVFSFFISPFYFLFIAAIATLFFEIVDSFFKRN